MRNDRHTIPDEDTLADLLQRLQPEPGERFRRRMTTVPWTRKSKQRRFTVSNVRTVRFAVAASLMAVLSLIVLLATPWGQALAQEILRFFQPAPSEYFDAPSGVSVEPEAGPTMEPPAFLTVAEAEARIGFDAKELPEVPTGLRLLGATVSPALEMIKLNYGCEGGGCGLIITQSRAGWEDTVWSGVPGDAGIEKVMVNGLQGEYVKGTFVVMAGATEATWNPDAPIQRLRWQDGNTLYAVELMGDAEPVEWIDKEALIALAESLE